jgi:porphobilinogen synthase
MSTIPTRVPSQGINPSRARPAIRRLYQRARLAPSQLSAPLLVRRDLDVAGLLPGQTTLEYLPAEAKRLARLGLGGVKVFVLGHGRDERASGALAPDNHMVQAVHAIKDAAPELAVTTEVCGCSWTTSRECVLRTTDGEIDLPVTLDLMQSMAVAHADAGADAVSPTAMLDGSIRAVRAALDHGGHADVSVNPNIAVHTSLYGPFKQVMRTDPVAGNRLGLQLDAGRLPDAALQTATRWEREGADALTLQPVMTQIDTLAALTARTSLPVTAYSTSGEWAGLRAIGPAAALEYHQMLIRSGADHILTYLADQVALALQDDLAGGI